MYMSKPHAHGMDQMPKARDLSYLHHNSMVLLITFHNIRHTKPGLLSIPSCSLLKDLAWCPDRS